MEKAEFSPGSASLNKRQRLAKERAARLYLREKAIMAGINTASHRKPSFLEQQKMGTLYPAKPSCPQK